MTTTPKLLQPMAHHCAHAVAVFLFSLFFPHSTKQYAGYGVMGSMQLPYGSRNPHIPKGICTKSQALPLASQRQKIRPFFRAEKLTRIVLAGESPLTPCHAPNTERFTSAGNGNMFINAALWRHSQKGKRQWKKEPEATGFI